MNSLLLDRRSSQFDTIVIFGGAIVLVTICVSILYLAGFDAVAALRDSAISEKKEAGLISNVGIILMGSSALFALFRGWLGNDFPIIALGFFCGFFVLDDALLLHESLGTFEVLFFVFYGAFFLFILTTFTRANEGRAVWPIIYAFVAFAVSVTVDMSWEPLLELADLKQANWPLSRIGYCLEDIPKFGGIVLISSFAFGEGLSASRPA